MSEAMIVRKGGAKKLQERTVSPSTSAQIVTPAAGFGGMSKVTVNAISPTKAAQTYTPGTSDQAIAAGQWLTGAQTIKGDANLVASNIKEGVTIFGKTGTFGGFNTAGAILKVITSSGCTVKIQNGSYVKTQQTGEGFVRSGDANVKEHFFSIPASAFGTFTVTASKVYSGSTLTNSKTIAVNTADRVYEIAVAAPNIILDSTFGLQSGYSVSDYFTYNARDKTIISQSQNDTSGVFSQAIPVSAFSTLTVAARGPGGSWVYLKDQEGVTLVSLGSFYGEGIIEHSGSITNKYYPTAYLYAAHMSSINKIVLN